MSVIVPIFTWVVQTCCRRYMPVLPFIEVAFSLPGLLSLFSPMVAKVRIASIRPPICLPLRWYSERQLGRACRSSVREGAVLGWGGVWGHWWSCIGGRPRAARVRQARSYRGDMSSARPRHHPTTPTFFRLFAYAWRHGAVDYRRPSFALPFVSRRCSLPSTVVTS